MRKPTNTHANDTDCAALVALGWGDTTHSFAGQRTEGGDLRRAARRRPVLAPRLLTIFGERVDRSPDAAALQKYAGVAPVRERSHGRLWVHWRWAAPKFLRQTLVEWAGQTVPRCAWAKEH